ncbi:MAG TPA: hypothetical protein VNH11_27645 [Pirellulales bacterium]|nr:hypothetical protein [Pirellulales bacterium]
MQADRAKLRPVIGDSATKLGVRARDLKPDADGNARPDAGGVSVVSSIAGIRRRLAKRLFSPSMLPQRLSDLGKVPGANGPNSLHLFRLGEGDFISGTITEQIALKPDRDDHGTLQPAFVMPYESYRQAIIDTRDLWCSGEGDDDS